MSVVSKQIYFSVDDTFGCFSWLHKNRKFVKDIFDSSTFSMAREIYENYGISTAFYCMYTDGKDCLSDFSSEWQEELRANEKWMKFGFHCYDGNSDYGTADWESIDRDFSKVTNELIRITGGNGCLTNTLRLHCFKGNAGVSAYLKKRGVNRLLCADDNRGSYNLSEDAERELIQKRFYYDKKTGMEYVPTDFRLENINNFKTVHCKVRELPQDYITVFTHERYLRDKEIRSRLKRLIRICMDTEENGHGGTE